MNNMAIALEIMAKGMGGIFVAIFGDHAGSDRFGKDYWWQEGRIETAFRKISVKRRRCRECGAFFSF